MMTAPSPIQPAVGRMTDEEIMGAAREHCHDFRWPSSAIAIARAIEAKAATRQTGEVDQAWVERIRAEERERCAEVCEALGKDACGPDGVPNDVWASAYKHVADDCAQSIRASTALGAKGKS